MKYLFLSLGGLIFIESAKAYWNIGREMNGGLGALAAILVFLLAQGFEMRPIVLTKGQSGVMDLLGNILSGKPATVPAVDPKELFEASAWALLAYGVDFVAGLNVWPPVRAVSGLSPWSLVSVGGLTPGNIQGWNVIMIVSCVFGMQFCVRQYLKRGGIIPFQNRRKAA
jgi:hypothetical protein